LHELKPDESFEAGSDSDWMSLHRWVQIEDLEGETLRQKVLRKGKRFDVRCCGGTPDGVDQ
jgi:hypothetical protein